MPRPVILIGAHRLTSEDSRNPHFSFFGCVENYVDAIDRAGGRALLAVPTHDDPADVLAGVDGLLLAGGGDVDPSWYGEAAHPKVEEVDRLRDEFEFGLFHRARTIGLPILAICRGMQLVNVALGGTLHQHFLDLPEFADAAERHCWAESRGFASHDVLVEADSALASYVGGPRVAGIASAHHQGVATVAPGLRVVARADDGFIEAVEFAGGEGGVGGAGGGGAFLAAVQWHPEMTAAADPAQQGLFDAFVAAAR